MIDNNEQINLLTTLSPAAPENPDAVQKEPSTYHRRGQRFKSSTAHHVNSSHNEELPLSKQPVWKNYPSF